MVTGESPSGDPLVTVVAVFREATVFLPISNQGVEWCGKKKKKNEEEEERSVDLRRLASSSSRLWSFFFPEFVGAAPPSSTRGVMDPVFSGSGSSCLPAQLDLDPELDLLWIAGTTSKLEIGSIKSK